ncbi:MAG: DUF362 domain-containing protein [Candidatus Methanospirareceae archaeon]
MAEVYRLAALHTPASVRKLLQSVADIERGALVAVKLHMGELINYRFIRPPFVRELVMAIKEAGGNPFITDTTTLIHRARHDAVEYLETARRNGFNFDTVGAPVLIADGLKGESGVLVETGGTLVTEVELGQAIYEADYLVTVTHCTGHISVGYAGALKDLGMGCCSKNGKRAVYRFAIPLVDGDACERCESCIAACPYEAIQLEDVPVIDTRTCIGCGRCISACPTGALYYPAGWDEQYFTALVEVANGVLRKFGTQCCFINFLTDITAMCDCTFQEEPLLPDLGALASCDLLSIEQASYDLIRAAADRDLFQELFGIAVERQFSLAEVLGMGERNYTVTTFR